MGNFVCSNIYDFLLRIIYISWARISICGRFQVWLLVTQMKVQIYHINRIVWERLSSCLRKERNFIKFKFDKKPMILSNFFDCFFALVSHASVSWWFQKLLTSATLEPLPLSLAKIGSWATKTCRRPNKMDDPKWN